MITVIFSATVREDADLEEVQGGQLRMLERLMDNPGFLEAKPYTSDDGETVMIVKFASQEALDAWRQDPEHIVTMERGRAEWLTQANIRAGNSAERCRPSTLAGEAQQARHVGIAERPR